MSDAVLLSIDDGIADLRLNRPDCYNAIIDGLLVAGESLRATPTCRLRSPCAA